MHLRRGFPPAGSAGADCPWESAPLTAFVAGRRIFAARRVRAAPLSHRAAEVRQGRTDKTEAEAEAKYGFPKGERRKRQSLLSAGGDIKVNAASGRWKGRSINGWIIQSCL